MALGFRLSVQQNQSCWSYPWRKNNITFGALVAAPGAPFLHMTNEWGCTNLGSENNSGKPSRTGQPVGQRLLHFLLSCEDAHQSRMCETGSFTPVSRQPAVKNKKSNMCFLKCIVPAVVNTCTILFTSYTCFFPVARNMIKQITFKQHNITQWLKPSGSAANKTMKREQYKAVEKAAGAQ